MSTIDWVVVIILVGALTIGLLSMLFGKIVEVWDWLMLTLQEERPALPSTPRTEEKTDMNADERPVQGSRTNVHAVLSAPPNADELRMLGEAIRHNAKGASKQKSIEVAFHVSKGGSVAWRRASYLYDLASAPPPDPLSNLRAQQQPRWEPDEITK